MEENNPKKEELIRFCAEAVELLDIHRCVRDVEVQTTNYSVWKRVMNGRSTVLSLRSRLSRSLRAARPSPCRAVRGRVLPSLVLYGSVSDGHSSNQSLCGYPVTPQPRAIGLRTRQNCL